MLSLFESNIPSPTNDNDHGAAVVDQTFTTDADGRYRASHGSLDRDWEALARKLAIEPIDKHPNAVYALCGKIPKTNADVSNIISSLLYDCFPWLRVHEGKPTDPDCYLFSISFISDEQHLLYEDETIRHLQKLQTESTAASPGAAG